MKGFLGYIFVILSVVGFHEFAHFVFMKLFGTKVIRFSIGFGKVLFRKKIGETEYQIALLPLGGFVMPLSERMKELAEYKEYQEPDHPEKYIEARPPWQRIIIYLAGPFSNLLFAFLLYYAMFAFVGTPKATTVVGSLIEDFPAVEAGIKPGDIIKSIDGKKIEKFGDIPEQIQKTKEAPARFKIDRNGVEMEIMIKPKIHEGPDGRFLAVGISPEFIYSKAGLLESIKLAYISTKEFTELNIKLVRDIFTGKGKSENVGGPIMIYQVTSQASEMGLMAIINIMISLNIALFVMNMLPIPVLDGGQIYPAILEMFTGIKMNRRAEEIWQAIGVVMVLMIFVLAMWNDISRLAPKKTGSPEHSLMRKFEV